MTRKMNNNYHPQKSNTINKKLYQTPQIRIYGKIADITYGSGGSGLDSAANLPGPRPGTR
jgi:hypothetical protein